MKKGQALIPVLIIIAIVLSLGVAAMEVSISSLLLSVYKAQGHEVLQNAYSANEEALLKLLRNPQYLGESLQLGESSCNIEVTGTTTKIIQTACASQKAVRKLETQVSFLAGEMEVLSLQEIE